MSNVFKILNILVLSLVLSVTFSSNANFGFKPTGVTQIIGGSGGSPVGPITCPNGLVAIGMEGKEIENPSASAESFGYLSDYITRCGEFIVDSTNNISTKYVSSSSNTTVNIKETRGPSKSIDCPSGSVLVGFSGYERNNNTFSKLLVDSIRPRCSKMVYDSAKNKIVLESAKDVSVELIPSTPPANSTATAVNNRDCPSNEVIYGFQGRVGELFDQFSLACASIDQSTLQVSIGGPNYANYQVLIVDSKGNTIIGAHKQPIVLPVGEYTLSIKNTVTSKVYSNFDCPTIKPVTANPYKIMTVNDQYIGCTIEPSEEFLKILTINESLVNTTATLEIMSKKPTIGGTSAINASITVTDKSGKKICDTKSDDKGFWVCVSDIDFDVNQVIELIATENGELKSNIAKVTIKTNEPVKTVEKVNHDHQKMKEMMLPRTGGENIYYFTFAFGLVILSIIMFKKYKKN
jgi:hypothetical protein